MTVVHTFRFSLRNPHDYDTVVSKVKGLKEEIRRLDPKARFRVRGRGSRKAAFAMTGRYVHPRLANLNDVSLSCAEAPFMDSFTVYVYQDVA